MALESPGFDPRLVHVEFVVDKVPLGHVFLRALDLPLSVSYQQCYILVFNYMLLYQKDKRAKHGKLQNK